MSVTINHYNRK